MKIQEILQLEHIDDIITHLKKRPTPLPDITTYDNEYDIAGHEINNPTFRPDKTVNVTDADGKVTNTRIEKVARVAIAFQKLIVGRAAAFAFGNSPNITSNANDDNSKSVFDASLKILSDNKSISHNKKIAKESMRYTEAAECWYTVPEDNERYGFASKFKVRVRIFSPSFGDTLYPLFDEYGDLIAFSRSFKKKDEKGVEFEYFETYTAEKTIKWKRENGEWAEVLNVDQPLKKIPVVYVPQDDVEWADAQPLINRIEKLLSNFADTNDYHGSPKIFVKGELKGFSKKGESGAVIEGGKDSDASYLSWDHAPESVKLEIETLRSFIHSTTQTPDISFDAIKGINEISGIALKLLFLDAHLKVEDKKGIYIDMLQRRMSILKAYVGILNTKLAEASKKLEITCDIDPYMPGDLAADVTTLLNAAGGKAIISQRTAIGRSGLVKDADAEYNLIKEEDAASNVQDIFNPQE